MSIDVKQIGQQIQKARRLKKWSTADLADRVHYTAKSIVYAENGQADLSLEFLLALCNALDVTPNDLLDGLFPAPEKSLEERALRTELEELAAQLRGDDEEPSDGTRIKDTETTLQEIREMILQERLECRGSSNLSAPPKKKGHVHW